MAHIHNAILALNPTVVTITGDVAIDANGAIVQYDLEAAQTKLIELQAQEDAKEQAAKDAKISALAKLSALGLTADEVKALLG
jgi:hypothetical protein